MSSQTSSTVSLGALEKWVLEEGRPWMAEELERDCGRISDGRECGHPLDAPKSHFACFPILIRVMSTRINMNQSGGICK